MPGIIAVTHTPVPIDMLGSELGAGVMQALEATQPDLVGGLSAGAAIANEARKFALALAKMNDALNKWCNEHSLDCTGAETAVEKFGAAAIPALWGALRKYGPQLVQAIQNFFNKEPVIPEQKQGSADSRTGGPLAGVAASIIQGWGLYCRALPAVLDAFTSVMGDHWGSGSLVDASA